MAKATTGTVKKEENKKGSEDHARIWISELSSLLLNEPRRKFAVTAAKCTPHDSILRKSAMGRIADFVGARYEEKADKLSPLEDAIYQQVLGFARDYQTALELTNDPAHLTSQVTGILRDSIEELRKKIIDEANAEMVKTVDEIGDIDVAWPIIETDLAKLKLRLELVDKLKGAHDAHFAATMSTTPTTAHYWKSLQDDCKNVAKAIGDAITPFFGWLDNQAGKLAEGPMTNFVNFTANLPGATEGPPDYWKEYWGTASEGFAIKLVTTSIASILNIPVSIWAMLSGWRKANREYHYEKKRIKFRAQLDRLHEKLKTKGRI